MLDVNPKRLPYRVLFFMLGLSIIGFGLAPLRRGFLFYQNWWGGAVFGPFAIVFGLVFILGALFKPEIFRR